MDTPTRITTQHFRQRLEALCLRSGLSGFPKDETDQHILLKSVVLLIGQPGPLGEPVVNERLQRWLLLTGNQGLDHVTLRRALVDAGYLTRSPDGSAYLVEPAGAGWYTFEPEIEQIDVADALAEARAEIERRKQQYLQQKRKD